MYRKTLQYLLSPNRGKVLIAAHRGSFGVSVMENSITAFNIAIIKGANMVEMDIACTKDGVLVCHHDDTLQRSMGITGCVGDYLYEELQEKCMVNYLLAPVQETLCKFEDVLLALKGKTLLILDKSWDYLDQIYDLLVKHEMKEQVIIKFYIENENAYHWAQQHVDILSIPMYKPEFSKKDFFQRAITLKRQGSIAALEISPADPCDEIFQQHYIESVHNCGIKVWCNSLSVGGNVVFGAGYDDTLSLMKGGNEGWGMLIKQGVDIIQTDWPDILKSYLEERGIYEKPS